MAVLRKRRISVTSLNRVLYFLCGKEVVANNAWKTCAGNSLNVASSVNVSVTDGVNFPLVSLSGPHNATY